MFYVIVLVYSFICFWLSNVAASVDIGINFSAVYDAHVGDTASLACNADESRPAVPAVDWKYHRKVEHHDVYICMSGRIVDDYSHRFSLQQHDNTTLIIQSVGFSDTGIYHCIEHNTLGPTHTIYLSVSPKISDDSPIPTYITRIESTLSMPHTCPEIFDIFFAVRVLLVLLVIVMISVSVIMFVYVSDHCFGKRRRTVRRRSTDEQAINLFPRTESADRHEVAKVVRVIQRADAILGLALMDSELYVLRCTPTDHVEVYTVTLFDDGTINDCSKSLKSFTVSGLAVRAMADMAVCKRNKCLYLTDDFKDCVHRVLIEAKNATPEITSWLVKNKPRGLSVTSDSEAQVLITCREHRKLKVFSTHGYFLREIILDETLQHPWHAIRLPHDQFLVAHGLNNTRHRVCIVDEKGQLLKCYGDQKGSAKVGQLNWPSHLAVDKNGIIYVSDCNNGRVVLLSSELKYRDVIESNVSNDDPIQCYPRRLCLDADRELLYVADCLVTSGRVVVLRVKDQIHCADISL